MDTFPISIADIITMIAGFLSIMGTLVYVGRKVGSVETVVKTHTDQARENTKNLQLLLNKLDKLGEEIQTDKREVAKLGVALFGIDGSNGLRSEIRKLSDTLCEMDKDWRAGLSNIEARVLIVERKLETR